MVFRPRSFLTKNRAKHRSILFRTPPKKRGENAQPRSYGRVLRAIREDFGLGRADMFDALCLVKPEYETLPDEVAELFARRFPRKRADGTPCGSTFDKLSTYTARTAMVRRWENSEIYMSFPFQLRYAVLTNTRNGVAHMASAYYADVRSLFDSDASEEERQRYRKKIRANLDGLKAFTEVFEKFVLDIEKGSESELARRLDNKKTKPVGDSTPEDHLRFILDLIDAYALKPVPTADEVAPIGERRPAKKRRVRKRKT